MKRRFSLLLFLLLSVQLLFAQKTYLVAVGISDYPGTASDLRLPVNDARTMAELCRKNNDAEYICLLNSNATVAEVKKSMSRLFSKARKDDNIILFFAGHGVQSGFCMYDGVFAFKEVRRLFSQFRNVNKLVFADACCSGGLRVNSGSSGSGKQNNVVFFLSSRGNESSMEIPSMKNGLFTAFLERGLRGGADEDRNRRITAKELYDFVSNGVRSASKEKQHPVMWGSFSDKMTIMKW